MSAASRHCSGCGHPSSGDAMFCGKCGAKLSALGAAPPFEAPELAEPVAPEPVAAEPIAPEPVAPEPVAPEPVAPAPVAPAPVEAEPASQERAGSPFAERIDSDPPPTAPAAATPARKSPRRAAGAAKTMLGMALPDADAVAAARKVAAAREIAAKEAEEAAAAAAPPRRIAGTARTMLGVPSAQPELQAAIETARANAERAAQANAERAARDAGRTETGPLEAGPVDAGPADAAEVDAHRPGQPSEPGSAAQDDVAATTPDLGGGAATARAAPPRRALDPNTNRTMLGQPAPKVASEPPSRGSPSSRPPGLTDEPSARSRAAVIYPANTGEQEALTYPLRKSGPGLAMVALVAGAVILLIGGGALAYTIFGGGSPLRATVVQGPEGELLSISVPGAGAETRVRFGGTERALEAGAASFPLSADDLTLGDNELTVDVVSPDGSVESHAIELHLEMRVRADLGALQSTPPAIDVLVEAPPGSTATLDGEALPLDARGRGTRRFVIDGSGASVEGVVAHVVRYRVQPPESEAAQGELRTRIPLTTMQLDRPGMRVVTESAEIEVAGAVAPGSTVTVDGEELEVRLGRFLYTLALPEVGERTVDVVARAPGKAPHLEQIVIRRVASLEAEAAQFEVNEALTYGRIASRPVTYRGQRVGLTGTVYNVDVRDGRSILQVLVDGCASGESCPLWVTYPAATEAEDGDRVRILGEVAGEQQFRSNSGPVRTVPRVDATFVLPAPAAPRRR